MTHAHGKVVLIAHLPAMRLRMVHIHQQAVPYVSLMRSTDDMSIAHLPALRLCFFSKILEPVLYWDLLAATT
jgi:hypothetical protein